MKKKKQLLGLSLLLIGIALFLFPFLSMIKEDIWQSKAQRTYQQTSEKTFQKQRAAVEQTTVTGAIQDIFLTKKDTDPMQKTPYSDLLDTNQVAGRMSIPALGQHFDLYLDADYDKLLKGVATLVGTSAPLGIKGQRPIIAGHRINYNGMSFYFLPFLKKGDRIYFDILGKNLEYEVTDSEVIDEYESEKLKPIENEDMVTLMTCVNEPSYDKRLLVNAKRVVSDSEKKQNVSANPLISFVSNQHIKLDFKLQRLAPYLIVIVGTAIFLFFTKRLWNIIKKH